MRLSPVRIVVPFAQHTRERRNRLEVPGKVVEEDQIFERIDERITRATVMMMLYLRLKQLQRHDFTQGSIYQMHKRRWITRYIDE